MAETCLAGGACEEDLKHIEDAPRSIFILPGLVTAIVTVVIAATIAAVFMLVIFRRRKDTGRRLSKATPSWQLNCILDLPCYHGVMNAKTAESALRENGGTCHLIRYSENREMYILTVMAKVQGGQMTPYHFEIKITKKDAANSYEISGSEKKFDSISKLLEFYQRKPLSQAVETVGHRCTNSAVTERRRYTEEKIKEAIPQKTQCSEDRVPLKSVRSSLVFPQRVRLIHSRSGGKSLDDLALVSTHLHTRSAGSSKTFDDTFISRSLHMASFLEKPDTDYITEENDEMATPSLSSLTLLKWTDADEKPCALKLIDQISPKWKRVGIMLGQQMSTLDNIAQKTDDNMDRCLRVFSYWIETQGSHNYPLTWDGLYELLRDIDHATAATRLMEVIKTKKRKRKSKKKNTSP